MAVLAIAAQEVITGQATWHPSGKDEAWVPGNICTMDHFGITYGYRKEHLQDGALSELEHLQPWFLVEVNETLLTQQPSGNFFESYGTPFLMGESSINKRC